MANQQNVLTTQGQQANAGFGNSVFIPKRLRQIIFVPDTTELTPSFRTNLRTLGQQALYAPAFADRWQMPARISDASFTGEEAGYNTSGYGDKYPEPDPLQSYLFTFMDGGEETARFFRSLNGQSASIFVVDEDGILRGQRKHIALNGTDNMVPIKITNIRTKVSQFPVQKEYFKIEVEFVFADADQYTTQGMYFEPGFQIGITWKSMMDIFLSNPIPGVITGGQITIAPVNGATNLAVAYPTIQAALISGNGAVWTTTQTVTGATVPITGATYVKDFGIRLTHTLTGITSGTALRTLIDTAALTAAGVPGYETPTTFALEWQAP